SRSPSIEAMASRRPSSAIRCTKASRPTRTAKRPSRSSAWIHRSRWSRSCREAGAPEVEAILQGAVPAIPVIDDDRYNAVHAADLVWTASGTATVEIALLGRPMIIVYRLSWLTYWIARCLVRVRHIGMVNLIAEERLMP